MAAGVPMPGRLTAKTFTSGSRSGQVFSRRHGISCPVFCTAVLLAALPGLPQTAIAPAPSLRDSVPASALAQSEAVSQQAEAPSALQTGTELTRRGLLQEAIPHLLAAQSRGADRYATAVNLGICYLGLGRYKEAIAMLDGLRASALETAAVDNLLTQSYLGDKQPERAWQAFLQAAALTPKDEKLYDYVADACADRHAYRMGLHVAERGLEQLPDSPRLHYERALFLARLDRLPEARPEFERAAALAPGTYIACLALVQEDLYGDNLAAADRRLHEAISDGHRDYQMLSLLGAVLLNEGAVPGQPAFGEAQAALEESAAENPSFSATQIALGKLYNLENRFTEAAAHLEIARRLEPDNPSVYANLAHAYRRLGHREQAQQMQSQLGRLLAEEKAAANAPPP